MSTTSRIGCLRIPDFPIAAHLHAEGGRQGGGGGEGGKGVSSDRGRGGDGAISALPVLPALLAVVVRGEGTRRLVAAASPEARRRGIRVGMKAADAHGLHPELVEWPWSPALYDEVGNELAAALLAATPRVGRAEPGVFWLDAGGWDRLGGEEAFVEAARAAALAAGYPEARIGVADAAATARAATWLRGRSAHRVPPGEDARFLAPLPLRALPIGEELLELLAALGLERVGQFAELKPGAVEARLGVEGVRAHRWARGLRGRREGPFAGPPPAEWSVEVELPGPLDRLEPLIFLLKSCLDRLSDALAAQGLCAGELKLVIETEDGAVEEAVKPARPTRRAASLLSLCRSALEGLRLPGRALGLRVEAGGVAPAVAEQADLFEPPRPDPDALATALTRLQGRWGPAAVVRPQLVDSHRPERTGRWEPVDLLSELTPRRPEPNGAGGVCDGSGAFAGNGGGERELPFLVLRLWPRPRPLEVRIDEGVPGAVSLDDGWREVRALRGPERLSGDWWEDGYAREYYRVVTESGDLLWIFFDPRQRGWFWHGWWD